MSVDKRYHRLLKVLRDPVLQIGMTPSGFSQGFDATFSWAFLMR
jgi:hypothetical protein